MKKFKKTVQVNEIKATEIIADTMNLASHLGINYCKSFTEIKQFVLQHIKTHCCKDTFEAMVDYLRHFFFPTQSISDPTIVNDLFNDAGFKSSLVRYMILRMAILQSTLDKPCTINKLISSQLLSDSPEDHERLANIIAVQKFKNIKSIGEQLILIDDIFKLSASEKSYSKYDNISQIVLIRGLLANPSDFNPYLADTQMTSWNDLKKWLSAFSLYSLPINSQNVTLKAVIHYYIERVTNINLINKIATYTNHPDSTPKTQVFALYPLVNFRLKLLETIQGNYQYQRLEDFEILCCLLWQTLFLIPIIDKLCELYFSLHNKLFPDGDNDFCFNELDDFILFEDVLPEDFTDDKRNKGYMLNPKIPFPTLYDQNLNNLGLALQQAAQITLSSFSFQNTENLLEYFVFAKKDLPVLLQPYTIDQLQSIHSNLNRNFFERFWKYSTPLQQLFDDLHTLPYLGIITRSSF